MNERSELNVRRYFVLAAILAAAGLLQGTFAWSGEAAKPGPAAHYTYRVVAAYPHDPDAFTQGLVIDNGILYEGTGIKGRSSLRRVDLQSGKVQKLYDLPSLFFGEGITVFGDVIIQLTWKSKVGLVYDRETFKLLKYFTYSGEGWGLTHDGQSLIMSDGTDTLRFLHPDTFEEQRRITVADGESGPVALLNELEYINGSIYANIWSTDRIAIIDHDTGQVTGWLDLAGLLPDDPENTRLVDVLNGIAYDRDKDALYVTGKLWPKLFHIEPVPANTR